MHSTKAFAKIFSVAASAVILTLGAFSASANPLPSSHLVAADTNPKPADKTEKKLQPQTSCPVIGGKIDKSSYLDYQGKRIYFCCDACKDEFKKDPAKYLKKMKDAGEEPETLKK